MKYKIVIIGYGYWGPKLARNFLNSAKFDISFVIDKNERNLIKAKNDFPLSRTINNYRKINPKNVDLVVISSPTSTHYSIAKYFLKHTNVLVEKPLAMKIFEVNDLERIAKKFNKNLFVDYPFIFSGSVNYVKKIIENNKLGKLLEVESYREQAPIRKDANVIWDLCVHDISILKYLLNKNPNKIRSFKYKTTKNSEEDTAYVHLQYKNNLNVFIKNSWLSPVKIRKIKFKFTKGFLICDENESIYKIRIYRKTKKNSLNYKMELPEIDLTEPLLNLVNYIAVSIKNKSNKIFQKKFNVEVSKILQKI